MGRGNVKRWPVHFIRQAQAHCWKQVSKEDEDGYVRTIGAKCLNCSLVAMQDIGTLSYFVVDSDLAELSCSELQIKAIIT